MAYVDPLPAADPPQVDEELLRGLAPIMRAVVRALGFGRARKFLIEHGGVNVNIPKYKPRAFGLEPEELARLRVTLKPHLDDNNRICLPMVDKLWQQARNAQIRKDRHHASIRTLARQNHLSSRQILNICREDDDQLSLFDE